MMTYETIESYSGVTREQIRRGLTVLAVVGVVHVDRVRSNAGVDRIASAYRLAHVDPYRHMGTIGRAEIPTPGPAEVVTDGLCSDPAAMKEIGNADRQEAGRRLNNRAENSHQPFRRRERAMQRFRSMKTLQKFSSVHAQVHNHFNQERHLVTRQVYKQRRSAALAEWSALAA